MRKLCFLNGTHSIKSGVERQANGSQGENVRIFQVSRVTVIMSIV
jgi:hypothetical protein